jgi:hypothetical protein
MRIEITLLDKPEFARAIRESPLRDVLYLAPQFGIPAFRHSAFTIEEVL